MKTKKDTGAQQASLRAGIVAASFTVLACFGVAIALAGEADETRTPTELASSR